MGRACAERAPPAASNAKAGNPAPSLAGKPAPVTRIGGTARFCRAGAERHGKKSGVGELDRHFARVRRRVAEAEQAPSDELIALANEHGHPVGLPSRRLRELVEHLAQRPCLVEHSHSMYQAAGPLMLGLPAACPRLLYRFFVFPVSVFGGGAPRVVPFASGLGETVFGIAQPLLQLGDALVRRPLHIVNLGLGDATRVIDLRLGLESGVGQCAPQITDLFLGRTAHVVGVSLCGVANVGELRVSLLTNFGGRSLSGLGHGAGTLLRCRAQQIVREGAEVGFQVTPDASERPIERLADLDRRATRQQLYSPRSSA